MQRNNYKSQDPFNESYNTINSKFATPERSIPMIPQQVTPNISQNLSQIITTENNKWINKTTNVNTKLFNILAANNADMFFNFLRDSSNYNNFQNIDNYLMDQLYTKLVDLLTKTANDNSIVAEYTLKWINLLMNKGLPENDRDAKKLQSLMFYLSNNVEDAFLREKVGQLLGHDYFFSRADESNLFSHTRRSQQES